MTSDRSNDVRQTDRGARVVDAHSRRTLLKTLGAGATAGIAGLAGCSSGNGGGGGDTTTTTTTSSDDGDDTTTTTEMDGDLADSIVVQMSGGHYLDSYKQNVFNKFEEEFGVDVEINLVSNQFDGYSKIKTGQSDTDATITSASTLYMGSEEDVWAEIDPEDVENYDSLLDTFKNPIYDPGQAVHGVPTVYGTIGMAYNRDELGEQDSWAAAWDTANEGRVTMEGFGFVRVFTTAMYLGMDPNVIEVDGSYEDGIEKVWDSVREQKPLITKYWTSGDEHVRLFAQKQALVGEAWGGRIFGAVQDGYDFLDYVVPKEGAYGWSDNWVMVKGLSEKKRRTVLTFMNFLLEEDTITPLTEMLGYPPATDAVSEGIKGLYDYDPSGGERLVFLDPEFKDQHNDAWSQTWEEIQSA
jgi:spermidine/putrescine-binding protein